MAVSIPSRIEPGDYYLVVLADADQRQTESEEGDNQLSMPITITVPDLELTAATAPVAAGLGESFAVAWTVTNVSSVDGAGFWYDYVYLSSDDQVDAGDRVISSLRREGDVAAGQEYSVGATVTVPGNTVADDQFLLFVADGNKQQSETSEANNVLALAIQLASADIEPISITAPAQVTVGSTTTSLGMLQIESDNTAYGTWSDYLYLSSDETLDSGDRNIGSGSHDALLPVSANTQYQNSRSFTFDNVPLGSQFLILALDGNDNLLETDEQNDTLVQPITVQAPDLALTDASVSSSSAAPGQDVNVTWTVQNQGDVPTDRPWYDYVYLSRDTFFGSDDRSLASVYTTDQQPLAAGNSYTLERSVSIDDQTLPGEYYLLFVADSAAVINRKLTKPTTFSPIR